MKATWIGAALFACLAATPALTAPEASLRPRARPEAGLQIAAIQTDGEDAVTGQSADGFPAWLAAFRRRAEGLGIDRAVLDAALQGIAYDPEIVRRDRSQFEFTKTVWTYLDSAASDARIRAGQAAMREHGATLRAVEAKWGVDARIVAAIWGLESAYGVVRGNTNVIEALATLAYDGRRGDFFESQLVAALSILQDGQARVSDMRGSWAGAMGHTQFMPTSYLKYAVDQDGDGRRDIWGDDPADALASTAAYLSSFGWAHGQPWGVEVTLPEGFDYLLADRRVTKLPSDWAALGVRAADGSTIEDHAPASILLPGGHLGAAFMIFPNFAVLERYNTADAYVIGVGHLGDRIMGGASVRADWPRWDRALTWDERLDLQRRLTGQGYDTKGIDGRIGPLTIDAVRAFQHAHGLVADGYPSPALLDRVRRGG